MRTKTFAVRLSSRLEERLRGLCETAQRSPSVVLRALVATATSEHLPRAWREGTKEERELLAQIEGK